MDEAQRKLAALAFEAGDLKLAELAVRAVLTWHPNDSGAHQLEAQIREKANR